MKIAFALLAASVLGLAGCSGPSGSDTNALARQQLAASDWNAAAVSLKAHLAEHPDAAESRFLLGTALAGQGNAGGAEVELRKALALKFPQDQVLPPLARAMLALGQPKKLLDEFERIHLADAAADAALKSALGTAHARLGNAAAAEAAYQDALRGAAGLVSAQLGLARLKATAGDAAGAMRQVDALLATHPAEPEAWVFKGDLLRHGQKQREPALAAYRKAIAVRADFLPAHFAIIESALEDRNIELVKAQHKVVAKLAPALFQTRFVEAQLAYVERDLPRARSLLQQLLVSQPDNHRALVLQGAVLLAMNANRSAETSLTKAVRQSPEASLARMLLAQVYLRTGQHADALTTLAPMLGKRPEDPTALTLAGQAHLQAGNFAKADELYQRAMQQSPDNLEVRTAAAGARLAKGDTDGALGELYQVASAADGDTADLMIIAAQQRRGDFTAALKAADALAAKQPGKAMPHELAGRIHLAMSDRAAARKRFEQAVALDARYFPAVLGLAMLDVAEKNPTAARSRLTQLVQAYPRHPEAQMALVELDIAQKVPKDAVAKSLAALIAMDPSYAPARLKLVELHLAAHAPKLAVSVAQEAVSSAPENPDFLLALGRSQLAEGNTQQAVYTFNKLISQLPGQAGPLLALADAQVAQGNQTAANATLRRALDVAPNDLEVHRRLMALAVAAKQPERAIEIARRLQRQTPDRIGGYLFEAEVEAGRSNWPATVAVLKTAMLRAPDQARPAAVKLVVAQAAAAKPTEAQATSEAWMKSHPKDSGFLVETGDLLLLRQSYAEAELQFAAAAQLMPKVASVHNNLAWVRLKQNKPQAVEAASQAVALAPGSAVMLDTYALALAANGQLDKGIATAKEAVALQPDAHVIRLNLAKLYIQAKRTDEARAELAKLEALGPSFAGMGEVRKVLASIGSR